MTLYLSLPARQGGRGFLMLVNVLLMTETAVSAVFQAIAFGSTIFRLYRRLKQRHLWWDDYWAFFAFVLDVAYCSTLGLKQGKYLLSSGHHI